MRVKTQDLLNALNIVKAGIAKRDIVEQMTHFIFTKKNVTAFDDQLCVSYPIETNLSCTVKADSLIKFLSKVESETLNIALKKDILKCTGRGISSEIPVLIQNDLYEFIEEVVTQRDETKTSKIPNQLIEAMRFCAFAASKDMTAKGEMCVGVKGKDVIATDRKRVSWCTLKQTTRKNFMIGAQLVIELSKFDEIIEFGVSNSWVHFNTENGVLIDVRRNHGEYPFAKCKSVFKDYEGIEIKLSKEDIEAVKEAVSTGSVLTDDELGQKQVEIKFEENKIICEGYGEKGKVTRKRKIKYNDESISFVVNPTFLLDVLNNRELNNLKISDTKLYFESNNFKHIMILKKI